MDPATTPPAPRGVRHIGSLRGVPVYVSPSWLLIAALLTASYGPVLRDTVPSVSGSTAYLAAMGFAVVFAACILAHEAGHTLVSLALGHPVRRIVLFALGGASEMVEEPERPRDELLISAAGPLVSLALAGMGWAGGLGLDPHALPGALLGLLCWTNLLIAAFNLLPGLPLDGGRLLKALLCAFRVRPLTATVAAAWTGRAFALVVAVSGLLVERTTLGFAAGVVSLALAAYLWFAAGLAVTAARLRARLPLVDVEQLLRPGLFVRADLSLAEALQRAWDRQVQGIVVLDAYDRPAALVEEARINQVPVERRPWVRVGDLARPLTDGTVLPVGLDATALLARMRAVTAGEYLVIRDDGSPAGIIATRDFARRLSGVAAPGARSRRGTGVSR